MVVDSPYIESSDAYMSNLNEEEEECNITSTNLRKNLTSAFEKHVEENSSRNKRERPPIAPNKSIKNKSEPNNKLLSVYLRIRPLDKPSSSSSSSSKLSESNTNTIEVIDEGGTTKIRAYPPVQSNAAKSARPASSRNNKRVHSGYSSNDEDSVGSATSTLGVKEYSFSQVFTEDSTQVDVFDNVAAPLVEGLFPATDVNRGEMDSPMRKKIRVQDKEIVKEGQSALLFAYGCTNAGKTHTMFGKLDYDEIKKQPKENCGILPRSLDHIFKKIDSFGNRYIVQMSYLEIYNEHIYDLLASYDDGNGSSSSRYNLRKRGNIALKLREDKDGRTYVHGLTKHNIQSVSKGLKIADHAISKRHSSTNNVNKKSSRSHCICQIELVDMGTDRVNSSSKVLEPSSKYLWLVDLAGTERSSRTGLAHKSINSREASFINSSLMTLMRCLQVISENQNISKPSSLAVVPIRDSKLTHFLVDHLSGSSNSRTRMIVNVNPSAVDYDETQHVLSYATVARTIKISADVCNKRRKILNGNNVDMQKKDRPLSNSSTEESNPPKAAISTLVKKLSPKRAAIGKLAIKKAELQSMRGATTTNKEMVATSEIGNLKSEIEKLKAENEKLQRENEVLNQEWLSKEWEIRVEVVEEMKEQIRSTEEFYKKKLRMNNMPTPQSIARVKKAEKYIESLIDKNDECEEEMKRMKARHDEEVDEILEDLNAVTKEMEDQRLMYEKTIADLKEQLKKANMGSGEEVAAVTTNNDNDEKLFHTNDEEKDDDAVSTVKDNAQAEITL